MTVFPRLFFYLCWPGLYVYFRIGDRSRVIVRCGGEVILVQGWWNRLFADRRWGLPGGGRKHGESPAEGACRELCEELGITAQPAELRFIGRQRVSDSGIGYMADFFALELPDKPDLVPHGETTAIDWSRLDAPKTYKQDVAVARHLERVNS